jgi:hypothetical protein
MDNQILLNKQWLTTGHSIVYTESMQDILVGNICKFEDFEPCPNRLLSYKIGKVIELTDDRIVYRVLLDIGQNESYDLLVGTEMTTARPWCLIWDWPTRVQILS